MLKMRRRIVMKVLLLNVDTSFFELCAVSISLRSEERENVTYKVKYRSVKYV